MVKNLRDLSKVIWNLLDELLTKGETKVLFGDEFVFSNCFLKFFFGPVSFYLFKDLSDFLFIYAGMIV